MSSFRDEANEALALMGEPPLRDDEVVVEGQLADGRPLEGPDDEPRIQLVEPPGHKRSDIVFMNGRRLILDMDKDQVVAAVREFNANPELDFLELDTIDVVGEASKGVIVRNRMHFGRRAVETIQSIGHFWTLHVPGRLMDAAGTDPAILDLRMNAAAGKRAARAMRRN